MWLTDTEIYWYQEDDLHQVLFGSDCFVWYDWQVKIKMASFQYLLVSVSDFFVV